MTTIIDDEYRETHDCSWVSGDDEKYNSYSRPFWTKRPRETASVFVRVVIWARVSSVWAVMTMSAVAGWVGRGRPWPPRLLRRFLPWLRVEGVAVWVATERYSGRTLVNVVGVGSSVRRRFGGGPMSSRGRCLAVAGGGADGGQDDGGWLCCSIGRVLFQGGW